MEFKNRIVAPSKTIIEVMRIMDLLDKKLLLVMDDNKFIGLISAGDIQRAIIQNHSLDTEIKNILRKDIRIAKTTDSVEEIREMMLSFRMELCPVVNDLNEISHVYFWEDIFLNKEKPHVNKFDIKVVIMAGGKGSRLSPLTNVLPKALIPVGEKTIIEEIIFNFNQYGDQKFYLSVNHKSDLIKYYLKNNCQTTSIEYFEETKPMGTAGSLSLLKGSITDTFFLTNCDILIEEDYYEILQFHKESKNEITLVSAMKHYDIPYGTIVSGENGEMISLTEKPTITFKINCGMYVLEPHLLDLIPTTDEQFHITDLIKLIEDRKGKIGIFPISEGAWLDIGNWKDYNQTLLRKTNSSLSSLL